MPTSTRSHTNLHILPTKHRQTHIPSTFNHIYISTYIIVTLPTATSAQRHSQKFLLTTTFQILSTFVTLFKFNVHKQITIPRLSTTLQPIIVIHLSTLWGSLPTLSCLKQSDMISSLTSHCFSIHMVKQYTLWLCQWSVCDVPKWMTLSWQIDSFIVLNHHWEGTTFQVTRTRQDPKEPTNKPQENNNTRTKEHIGRSYWQCNLADGLYSSPMAAVEWGIGSYAGSGAVVVSVIKVVWGPFCREGKDWNLKRGCVVWK